jgi:hypothetical protein
VYLARIGPRFLCYRVPELTAHERKEGYARIWQSKNRKPVLSELRRLIAEHIKDLLDLPVNLVDETPEQQQILEGLGEFMAGGRGVASWRQAPGGQWELDEVQREEPFRAVLQLRTLGRALARVHGRTSITDHELELLKRVALSSLSANRMEVLALFRDHPDGLTSEQCAEGTGKSQKRAGQLLDELSRLGLLTKEPRQQEWGRPANRYRLVPKFADFILKPADPLEHIEDLVAADFLNNSPPRIGEIANKKETTNKKRHA